MIPTLVVITGLSASGKSTVADFLSEKLGLTLISKDVHKERLFDVEGGLLTVESSKAFGLRATDQIFQTAEPLLKSGSSVILEGNFLPEYAQVRFDKLLKAVPCRVIQILCTADPNLLLERYKSRSLSGQRHAVHVDHLRFEEFVSKVSSLPSMKLELPGPCITLDTSDWSKVDLEELCATVKLLLS